MYFDVCWWVSIPEWFVKCYFCFIYCIFYMFIPVRLMVNSSTFPLPENVTLLTAFWANFIFFFLWAVACLVHLHLVASVAGVNVSEGISFYSVWGPALRKPESPSMWLWLHLLSGQNLCLCFSCLEICIFLLCYLLIHSWFRFLPFPLMGGQKHDCRLWIWATICLLLLQEESEEWSFLWAGHF